METKKLYKITCRDGSVIYSTTKANGYKNEAVMAIGKLNGKDIAILQAKDKKYYNLSLIFQDMRLAVGLEAEYDHAIVSDENVITDITPQPTVTEIKAVAQEIENKKVMKALRSGKTEAEAVADTDQTAKLMELVAKLLASQNKK